VEPQVERSPWRDLNAAPAAGSDCPRILASTQLVFYDLSTPDPVRFNVYEEVRSRLIAAGIPENEISFIYDAATDRAKMQFFNAVNAGRVRILIGSTEKMGAGTNVQRRLRALHHLDTPWRPRDIEQREGRILRKGAREEAAKALTHAALARRNDFTLLFASLPSL
jgi:hypothetical protein